jgi:hypothetical protein
LVVDILFISLITIFTIAAQPARRKKLNIPLNMKQVEAAEAGNSSQQRPVLPVTAEFI